MSGHRVAFVDEAFIHRPNHPGMYLFAGVVVDGSDLAEVIASTRQAAGQHGPFHATDLYKRGHLAPIEDMLDTVHAHAGWTFLVTQAPITGSLETARQATLSQLLRQLDAQKVRDVVLDTRASEYERLQTQLEGRKVARTDLPDVTTYRELVRGNQISPRLRVLHIADQQQPGLWLADAAAWSFQRALNFDEPQWLSRITDSASIIDAGSGRELSLDSNRAAPPSGERGPEHLSQSAQASLLTPRFYTLTGGTTNRSLGPGRLYATLISQTESGPGQGNEQGLADQVRDVSRAVATLSAAISRSADPEQPKYSQARLDTAASPPAPTSPGQQIPDLDIG
ncbi:hypothetical protein ACFY36_50625 [Actinoplanes sp. NPDC000266]